ncbi:MAG: prepilin-type N-terminal cleavage/methylation domain-containing protein [Candidatus Didemnitutus sp.]|nr:prepilin-type N-terminal cleavage/methylation domain-containing protein [Candidatus Didemnitutus sp.]
MRTRSIVAFTLIEVLISLAIVGIAAVALGAAYANTLGAHAAVAQRAAHGTVLDHLSAVVLNEPDREKVESGGDLTLPENRRLRWEAVVEEAAVPDLFKVTIKGRVEGGTAGGVEEFTQSVMLLRPTWSDPQRREQQRTEWRASRPEETPR